MSNDSKTGSKGPDQSIRAKPGGIGVSVTRASNSVQISFECTDDYSAIELYEHLVRSAQNGHLEIDLRAVTN